MKCTPQLAIALLLLLGSLVLSGFAYESWNAPCLTASTDGKIIAHKGQAVCADLAARLEQSSKAFGGSLRLDQDVRQRINQNRGRAAIYGFAAALCIAIAVGIFMSIRAKSVEAADQKGFNPGGDPSS